ncbi:MAG: hypothetical protein JJU29_21140 [Verrucomicrobia bacterium]|nr:hypothetical protein [Verrucomicrobiota bacterium]MCH8514343.1 HlyD family secretion protein [Kiritimatiellia bacterium]
MKTSLKLPLTLFLLATGVVVWMLRGGKENESVADVETHVVQEAEFSHWIPFQGTLESMRSENVVSGISQSTAILYLAPEGARVSEGDLVARFDNSSLQSTLANLERDYTLATTEYQTLTRAEIPLQTAKFESDLREIAANLAQEQRVAARMAELAEQELVSAAELATHHERVRQLETSKAALEQQRDLTLEILHPARIQQAEAKRESARRQLELVREQIEGSEIRAGIPGMVVYLPLHINGEYRTLREGDSVYRNQPFLQITDMETPVVRCLIPESRVSALSPGNPALILPEAFPDLQLEAEIISLGSVARSVPGRPAWQKFFEVTLLLSDGDPRLRTGMTVQAHVRAQYHPQTVVLPRNLVFWDGDRPHVLVRENGQITRTPLELHGGNDTHFRVAAGLRPGDLVLDPPGF